MMIKTIYYLYNIFTKWLPSPVRNVLLWFGAGILVVGAVILFLTILADPVYCGDSLEEYYELMNKISKVEGKVKYFSEQLEESKELMKEAFENNESESVKQEIADAIKDSETNLNGEKKILEILKDRHASRNFDASLSTPSSLGKRRLDD